MCLPYLIVEPNPSRSKTKPKPKCYTLPPMPPLSSTVEQAQCCTCQATCQSDPLSVQYITCAPSIARCCPVSGSRHCACRCQNDWAAVLLSSERRQHQASQISKYRRRSSASSVSVRSFQQLKRKVGVVWEKVVGLEKEKERREVERDLKLLVEERERKELEVEILRRKKENMKEKAEREELAKMGEREEEMERVRERREWERNRQRSIGAQWERSRRRRDRWESYSGPGRY